MLPEIWGKLVEADGWAQAYLSGFRQYPDLTNLGESDLDEFLEGTRFSEGQRRTIKSASNRQDAYYRIEEMYRSYDALEKVRDASLALRRHGIFVLEPLREDMNKFIDLMHTAIIEGQINHEHKVHPPMRDSYKALKSDGGPLFNKIEAGVRERLWDSATTDV